MRFVSTLTAAVVLLGGWILAPPSDHPRSDAARTPVLVELFTSEGCSSCPPADAFLQKLDRQPVSGADVIVLSEHVDYWNHIGWKDPFSGRFYSDRQGIYAKRFGLDSVYTPQMVVDGTTEFVGSNTAEAEKAFSKAVRIPKIAVVMSEVFLDSGNILHAHLQAGALPPTGSGDVEVYLAVALNKAESQVLRGENAGKRLGHTAVVVSMSRVGSLRDHQAFDQDIRVRVDPGSDPRNLRVIAFFQEPHQGKVVGAAVTKLAGQ